MVECQWFLDAMAAIWRWVLPYLFHVLARGVGVNIHECRPLSARARAERCAVFSPCHIPGFRPKAQKSRTYTSQSCIRVAQGLEISSVCASAGACLSWARTASGQRSLGLGGQREHLFNRANVHPGHEPGEHQIFVQRINFLHPDRQRQVGVIRRPRPSTRRGKRLTRRRRRSPRW